MTDPFSIAGTNAVPGADRPAPPGRHPSWVLRQTPIPSIYSASMATRRPIEPMPCHLRTVTPPPDRAALRRAVAAYSDGVMLESVATDTPSGRYSLYGLQPVRVFATRTRDPFDRLAREMRPWQTTSRPERCPWAGAWIGHLGYEAGRFIEPTAGFKGGAAAIPLSRWRLFDTLLIHDASTDEWTATAVDLPATLARQQRPPASERLNALERFMRSLPPAPGAAVPPPNAGVWNMSRDGYRRRVEQALSYIRAGDIFQVNLARQFSAPFVGSAVDLYQRLCEANPAAYAAFLAFPRSSRSEATAVLSSSPELFLRVRGRDVVTRPIKGTRPRVDETGADRTARAELKSSDKDRAELNMIIDLERNDLGRVCEYGSVRVAHDGQIETFPTVFHRTATVVGRLREDTDAIDLLRAAFPGGSITGAPKVRAMQIIRELEPEARGPYCGAIGIIGLNGDMQLNLAIRTMRVHGGVARLAVGGAIVVDSDPDEEYAETGAKARGMLAALGARTPDEPSVPVAAGCGTP